MMLYLFLKGSRRHFSKDVSAIQFLILAQRPYKAKRKYKVPFKMRVSAIQFHITKQQQLLQVLLAASSCRRGQEPLHGF
jgi:hypothetical protein